VLAVVVAIGGGTFLDLLLGEFPVSWLKSLWPVFVAIGTAVIVIIALRGGLMRSLRRARWCSWSMQQA
jgi:uncharacterized membrane protein YeiH